MFRVNLELGFDRMQFCTETEKEAIYLYKQLTSAQANHWDGKETERKVFVDYEVEEKQLKLVSFLNWGDKEVANGDV